MIYLIIIVGLVGLVMLIFGTKLLLQLDRGRTISNLELRQTINEVDFEKKGRYSICVVGGYANNTGDFRVVILNNGKQISLNHNPVQLSFPKNGVLISEFCSFEITSPGKHVIQFENIHDLEVKSSRLISNKFLQSEQSTSTINLLVRETQPGIKVLGGILLMVLGGMLTFGGIIFLMDYKTFFDL